MTAVILSTLVFAMGQPADPQPVYMPGCNTHKCEHRVRPKAKQRRVQRIHKAQVRWRAHMRKVVRPYNSWLERTARCESGGRWHINTGNGFYGGLQFTLRSWAAVGGRGMPHLASILEQKYRGVKLLWLQGRGAWPVCG